MDSCPDKDAEKTFLPIGARCITGLEVSTFVQLFEKD